MELEKNPMKNEIKNIPTEQLVEELLRRGDAITLHKRSEPYTEGATVREMYTDHFIRADYILAVQV